jgi:hypothetical protein
MIVVVIDVAQREERCMSITAFLVDLLTCINLGTKLNHFFSLECSSTLVAFTIFLYALEKILLHVTKQQDKRDPIYSGVTNENYG